MRWHWKIGLEKIFAAVVIPAVCLAVPRAHTPPQVPAPAEEIIACRVLEAHSSPELRVTLLIFHQDQAKDSQLLARLLRQHSETPVEFETNERVWHSATLIRLKSCFGRGLLLFPSGSVKLDEKDTFLLKFRAN